MLLWFEGKFGVWSDEKTEGHCIKGLFMDFGFSVLPCTAIHWEDLEMQKAVYRELTSSTR